ncbi:MAG: hypothetical protein LLF94_08420 [Chlamydiales bacterium]|nr:hypothetical protein [Chlamydiales bacterium]
MTVQISAKQEISILDQPSQRLHLSSTTLKTHVLIALKASHSSMDDLVTKALETVWKQHPKLHQTITDFKNKFPWHIQQMQQSGWKQLKADYGNKMSVAYNGCSFQNFRNHANIFIDNLTCQVGKELGLSDARWVAFGTIGYNSDVDTNVKLACTPVDIDETAFYKTLRDVVHYATFQGFSGPQLDTESYMPHAGEIDLSRHLSSHKAKMCFQTGEKACVIFQRVICLSHLPAVYEASKNKDLASITNPCEKRAVNRLYTYVEEVMATLHTKIKAICSSTLTFTEAKSLIYIPLRLKLGSLAARQQSKISKTEDKDQLDRLYLELQRTLILLTILQNEGTFSAAEGKATILQAGGQIYTEELRRRANSMPEDEKLGRHSLDEFKPKDFGRKSSAPQSCSVDSFVEDFSAMTILENQMMPYFENPTAQTNLIASEEESVQLEHEIHEGLVNHTPSQTVIKSGKYALRTCKNLFLALEACKKESKKPVGIVALAQKVKELVKKCENLEKCKRKIAICTAAATTLLVKELKPDNDNCSIIAEKIGGIFSRFDFGGDAELEIFQPTQHLESLKKLLLTTDGLKVNVDTLEGNLRSRVLSILEARAGFDRQLPQFDHLNSIHDEAVHITVDTLNLSTKDKVNQFLADIIDLGTKTRALAKEIGLLPTITEEMVKAYNFNEVLTSL